MSSLPSSHSTDGRYGRSAEHMARARTVLVRGVASAMREVQRPTPLVISSAAGSRLVDADGRTYIDYVLGFGPILLGHGAPAVLTAVEEQLQSGVLFGAQHAGEIELAKRVIELLPSAELVALSNTGSEAVQVALRIARVFTGRTRVLKFEGHYHGWLDPLYASSPGTAPLSGGDSPAHAVPGLRVSPDLLVSHWNDLDALATVLSAHEGEVAAVIMEPVACNFGNCEPLPGYLEGVRALCDEHGTLLIFDEVITGFRVASGGAQERYGVMPDLTVLAKAIASGFPLSVVTGRAEVMGVAGTDGPVQHVGTYNGNAISVAAANATLAVLAEGGPSLYSRLDALSERLASGLREAASAVGAPLVVNQVGSVLYLLWDPKVPVNTYADAYQGDRGAVADIAAHLLSDGVMALERGLWFVSAAHTEAEIDATVDAAEAAIVATLSGRGRRATAAGRG